MLELISFLTFLTEPKRYIGCERLTLQRFLAVLKLHRDDIQVVVTYSCYISFEAIRVVLIG